MAQTAEKNFGTVHTYREHCIYESIPQAAAKPETASSRLEGRGLWHIHYSDSIFREHFHHMHYASIDVMTECIQLFRQRLSRKSVKAYATMPIGIMGRKSLALIA